MAASAGERHAEPARLPGLAVHRLEHGADLEDAYRGLLTAHVDGDGAEQAGQQIATEQRCVLAQRVPESDDGLALRVAADMDRGSIVVLLADDGSKYLSTGLWDRDLDTLQIEMEGSVLW